MRYDYPMHSHVEVSAECNLRCPMCPLRTRKRKGGYMKPETMEAIGKQSVRKMKQIFFSMFREPTKRPQIAEMVKISRKYYDWMSIETNATLIDEKMAYDLMKAGCNKFLLDCDTLNPETYNKIRVSPEGTPPPKWQTMMDNIEGIIKVRNKHNFPCRIEVQIILSKWTQNEIFAWVEYWEKRIDKAFDTLRLKHWETWGGMEMWPDFYIRFIGRPWVKGRHLYFGEEDIRDPNITVIKPGTPKPACQWRRYEASVHWNGDVVPCFRYAESLPEGVGNVHDKGGIKAAWDKLMNLYDKVDSGELDEKKVLPYCLECDTRYFYESFGDISDRFRKRENI